MKDRKDGRGWRGSTPMYVQQWYIQYVDTYKRRPSGARGGRSISLSSLRDHRAAATPLRDTSAIGGITMVEVEVAAEAAACGSGGDSDTAMVEGIYLYRRWSCRWFNGGVAWNKAPPVRAALASTFLRIVVPRVSSARRRHVTGCRIPRVQATASNGSEEAPKGNAQQGMPVGCPAPLFLLSRSQRGRGSASLSGASRTARLERRCRG